MSEVYQLVLRMREDEGFSRNRHFMDHEHPLARRARRIAKRLRGIERELRSGAQVRVQRAENGYQLLIAFPAVRMRREAWLTVEEHALLCRDPALRAVLAAVAGPDT
jgi:hypothetical protein